MTQNTFSAEKIVLTNTLNHNGTVLLTYKIQYPRFSDSYYQSCLDTVNSFYETNALKFQQYCENELFAQAVADYQTDLEQSFPVRTFSAVLTYEISYCDSCVISVYQDCYEYTGGAHGTTVRQSQTWNLKKCVMVKLRQLIRFPFGPKAYIVKTVRDCIRRETSAYYKDYPALVSARFQEKNFYCTPEGLVIYYQQYDIAPYACGIREFLLPYGTHVLDPAALCSAQ